MMFGIKILVIFVFLLWCSIGEAAERRTPPKFLPVPRNILSVDDIRREIVGNVWTSVYAIFVIIPGSRGMLNADARQLRIFHTLSEDGKRFDRTLSLRTSINGTCLLNNMTFTLVPNRKMLGIWREPLDGGFSRELRLVSRCPSKYYWAWICTDTDTIRRGVCRGTALFILRSRQDPPDQVPFELAVKDLNKLGFKFTDPRNTFVLTGNACPI